jgi:acetyl esterase
MASVRLPVPVEQRILKGFCGLPPAVHRLVLGKPVRSEGQTLARDIQALLWLASLNGIHDLYAGLPPEQAREEGRRGAAVVAGPQPLPLARVEEGTFPGEVGPLRSRLYVPHGQPSEQPAPLLVYYHGGGWAVGDLDTHDSVCRFLAVHSGASVLSVEYRLAPEDPFPAAVEDAWAAFTWASANAERLGADPERIGVGGDSAGGNLAAVVSLRARDAGGPKPAHQLLIYPVTETEGKMPSRRTYDEGYILTRADMDAFEASYLPDGVEPGDPRICVLNVPDLSSLPPAYVITAGFDPLRDEGEAYALRMREAGNRVALRRHPGLIHSFAHDTEVCPTARAAMLEAAGALRMGLAAGAVRVGLAAPA